MAAVCCIVHDAYKPIMLLRCHRQLESSTRWSEFGALCEAGTCTVQLSSRHAGGYSTSIVACD